MRLSVSALVLFGASVLIGCGVAAPPETVNELAEDLRGEGVAFTSIQELPMPTGRHFKFDEGIALVGDSLRVELIRIEDERVFGIARDAGGLLTMTEAVAGQELPGKPELYARQPFVVVVRQEPSPGGVLEALDEVMPQS